MQVESGQTDKAVSSVDEYEVQQNKFTIKHFTVLPVVLQYRYHV
jgi:hypothetical protein